MSYEHLRALHITCAVMSVLLFLFRLALAARGIDYRSRGALRWVPHVIDTVLLLSAVALAWWSGQYPFLQAWLTAKVLLLPLYIIAAAVALDTNRARHARQLSAALACSLLVLILGIAHTRNPLPFFP